MLKKFAWKLLETAVWAFANVLVAVTVIPLWHTNIWWVRLLDFPRLQIACAGALLLVCGLFLSRSGRVLIPILMLAVSGYQLWRIFPYTPFSSQEMHLAQEGGDTIRILASNVLMENRHHDMLLGVIESYDPDILLLMETDQRWVDAVEPALERYSTVLREPKDDHYGMVFATRLATDDARIMRLTESETPSVFAEMTGPDGTTFRFVGLHPRPPVPGQSTAQRDAQIRYAATFASKSGIPLVTMGDFNDVAWSDTSQMFKHVGKYLDPRIGRGFFASFDAEKPYLRFPIDQLYVTRNVAVVSVERLKYIGSDHFPMAAEIMLDADMAAKLNIEPAPLTPEEEKEIAESVAKTRARLGHTEP